MTKTLTKRKTRTELVVQAKSAWQPRVRLPGECGPRQINVMAGQYDVNLDTPLVRAGSQDFLGMPSRGFST